MSLDLHRRLYAAEQALDRIASAADRDALARAEARADSIARMLGDRAPPPAVGEGALDYRRRLLAKFQGHSPQFSRTSFIPCDEATISVLEAQIYEDASRAAARHDHEPGHLRSVEERDAAGRLITRYYGDIGAWMDAFTEPGARVKINRNP